MKLLVGEGADFSGFALPDDCGFVFARRVNVAVEAVIGEIDLAADEPLRPREIPVENFVPLFEPMQLAGDAAPEFVGFGDRFLVEVFVFLAALNMGTAAEFGGRLEATLLLK